MRVEESDRCKSNRVIGEIKKVLSKYNLYAESGYGNYILNIFTKYTEGSIIRKIRKREIAEIRINSSLYIWFDKKEEWVIRIENAKYTKDLVDITHEICKNIHSNTTLVLADGNGLYEEIEINFKDKKNVKVNTGEYIAFRDMSSKDTKDITYEEFKDLVMVGKL